MNFPGREWSAVLECAPASVAAAIRREDNTAPPPRLRRKVKGKVRTADALSRTASLGRIEVSPRVVASIVAHAANESYGVVGMAARGLRDGIAERLNRENAHRGVVPGVTKASW